MLGTETSGWESTSFIDDVGLFDPLFNPVLSGVVRVAVNFLQQHLLHVSRVPVPLHVAAEGLVVVLPSPLRLVPLFVLSRLLRMEITHGIIRGYNLRKERPPKRSRLRISDSSR